MLPPPGGAGVLSVEGQVIDPHASSSWRAGRWCCRDRRREQASVPL
ncbi:hypothetical protein [Actinomyces sp. oral taxon 897]|nr:hypothetical protein [Actinomyces sp. oral taxon 897]